MEQDFTSISSSHGRRSVLMQNQVKKEVSLSLKPFATYIL